MKLRKIFEQRYAGIKDEHQAIKEGRPPPSFIPTNLREFDKRGGHKRKSIALYGGDTGGGKSLWKYHLAWAAATHGFSVTIVDLEDPEERTADRGFANETGINSARILSGDLTDEDIANIGIALMDMEWAENVTLHSGVRNGAEALALFEEDPGDLEIFDYLSALPHGKHGREREISDFMWGWTRHVQEHNVAAVALAQIKGTVSERGLSKFLNDQRWNRDDKKQPNIDMFRAYDHEDLVWCSDAGRNAKELGFMFRPGRVLKRPQINWSGAKDDVMEFDFPKRNWGAEGRIRVGIDIKTARFFDLPEKDPTQQKDDDGK